MFALDIVIHHPGLQGSRPEQCNQGNQIIKPVRLQAFDELLHPLRFKLEDGGGIHPAYQVKGRLVIQRDDPDIDGLFCIADEHPVGIVDGPIDNRQGTQSQEIKFDQTDGFHVPHVELGRCHGRSLFTVERHIIGQWPGGDNDTSRMLAGIPGQAFQFFSQIDQRPDLFLVPVTLPQRLLFIQGPVQGHVDIKRDQFGDLVNKTVGMPQYTADVTDHRFCRHPAEGNNLGYTFSAIAPGHVIDHFIPSIHAEIDIEVGQ